MTKLITFFENLIFTIKSKGQDHDDFADFFLRTSSADQKKVFKRVIRKANQDQKKYLVRYEMSRR
jgi:hypothetical protein